MCDCTCEVSFSSGVRDWSSEYILQPVYKSIMGFWWITLLANGDSWTHRHGWPLRAWKGKIKKGGNIYSIWHVHLKRPCAKTKFCPFYFPSKNEPSVTPLFIAIRWGSLWYPVVQSEKTDKRKTSLMALLMPLVENKTATTMFEPKLKQALLNSGQEDGHWPGPYWDSQRMTLNYVS